MNKEGALTGIKVIDLTRVISGPFCTLLLADMGAEVIKIEPPKGDNVRNQGEFVDGYSSYFAQFNRNKKSVVLDLYQNDDNSPWTWTDGTVFNPFDALFQNPSVN